MGEQAADAGKGAASDAERRRNDRRAAEDRRKENLGPPDGNERRKAERRSGKDRRHPDQSS